MYDHAQMLEVVEQHSKSGSLEYAAQWHITQHPKDVHTKVGEEATFSIVTSSAQFSYNWCLDDQSIPDDNPDYRGARTNKLVVLKPLSKHCGSYKCIVIDSDMNLPSNSAALEIGKFSQSYIWSMVQLIFLQMEPKLKSKSPDSLVKY